MSILEDVRVICVRGSVKRQSCCEINVGHDIVIANCPDTSKVLRRRYRVYRSFAAENKDGQVEVTDHPWSPDSSVSARKGKIQGTVSLFIGW